MATPSSLPGCRKGAPNQAIERPVVAIVAFHGDGNRIYRLFAVDPVTRNAVSGRRTTSGHCLNIVAT